MKKVMAGLLFCMAIQSTGFSVTVDDEFSILKGEILKIEENKIKRVLMYQEGILDIINTKPQFVEFMGVTAGETLVEIQTGYVKKIYRVAVRETDTDDLIKRIQKTLYSYISSDDLSVTKNQLTGRISLTGALDEEDLAKIDVLLGDYKTYVDNFLKVKESEDIVEINIEVVEINKDASQVLGVTWPSQYQYGEAEFIGDAGTISMTPGSATFRPFFNVLAGEQVRSSLGATVDFLISHGKAEILSNPKLACISGKEASLQIGGSTPVLTTADEGGTSVEYQDYGISMDMSPVVRSDGMVELTLNVEVSDVAETLTLGSTTETTASAPATTTRSTSTVVLMKDRETLGISGLIKKKSAETIRKLPWLGDIPVLGTFFKHTARNKGGDVELVVLVTPRIKRIDKPERKIADYTEAVSLISRNPQAGSDKKFIGEYAHKIRSTILSALEYPEEARRAGWQAKVKVSIHLSSDGYLLGVKMLEQSGYKTFDDRLMSTIQGIKYYPPFPANMSEKELWLDIPFVFELD